MITEITVNVLIQRLQKLPPDSPVSDEDGRSIDLVYFNRITKQVGLGSSQDMPDRLATGWEAYDLRWEMTK